MVVSPLPGLSVAVSTPQWMTSTFARDDSPTSATISSRLSREIATTNAASATLRSSMCRSTCRSDPCATKLNGMPVSRWMMNPAAAGWFEKWQWTWDTPRASISRAMWTTFGKMARPPKK